MPLLVGIHAEENRRITHLATVEPGSLHTGSDLSDGRRALIVAGCPPDDSGGVIWRSFSSNFEEQTDGGFLLHPEILSPDNVIADFGVGGRYEHRITTIAGRVGILVFQHIPIELLAH